MSPLLPRRRLWMTRLGLGLGLAVWPAHVPAQGVAATPHNLSVTGPGPLRARTETEICIFCHGVHNASPQAPLWNRRDPGGTYRTYASSTLKVSPGQPTGASRLCLSCHDGTIATGEILSRSQPIEVLGGSAGHLTVGQGGLGTDLRDDHPFSFSYGEAQGRSAGELRPAPMLGGRAAVDATGQVQCTGCHEPHDNRFGKFLRVDPRNGALCTACHDPSGWAASSHATSGKALPWLVVEAGGALTVAQSACDACHVPHGAESPSRLLRSAVDDDVCLTCHTGAGARYDIADELRKWSSHVRVTAPGTHDAAEVPDGRATHVACVDCHPPHSVNAVRGGALLPGAIAGASGLGLDGRPVAPARTLPELCLKCHDDTGDPGGRSGRIVRAADQPSVRRRILTSNASFHPIVGPGRNPDVPSLRAPQTVGGTIGCDDCHGNDAGPDVGGAGPRGPHGSRWPWLLARRYDTADGAPESAQAYALCYGCHDRASILEDQSFPKHKLHIADARTACSTCHDPHGVDVGLATAGDGTHLIDFDSAVVRPNGQGRREFIDGGRMRGQCSLTCHGVEHRATAY